jgi:hypothetical protein
VPIVPLYTEVFEKYLKKYSSIKNQVEKKIEQILTDPLLGEPLKYRLAGLFSAPVKRGFILIYSYCKFCRDNKFDNRNRCPDCLNIHNNTVIFHVIAPHDKAYKIMNKNQI